MNGASEIGSAELPEEKRAVFGIASGKAIDDPNYRKRLAKLEDCGEILRESMRVCRSDKYKLMSELYAVFCQASTADERKKLLKTLSLKLGRSAEIGESPGDVFSAMLQVSVPFLLKSTRCRWVGALREGLACNIPPPQLVGFIEKHGIVKAYDAFVARVRAAAKGKAPLESASTGSATSAKVGNLGASNKLTADSSADPRPEDNLQPVVAATLTPKTSAAYENIRVRGRSRNLIWKVFFDGHHCKVKRIMRAPRPAAAR